MELCKEHDGTYREEELNYYFKHHIGLSIPKKFLKQFTAMINTSSNKENIINKYFIYLANKHKL